MRIERNPYQMVNSHRIFNDIFVVGTEHFKEIK